MHDSLLSTQYSNTQSAILGAASQRLIKFGYTKTTMCEIASDLEMSTANLYRHYANKLDIVKACAVRMIKERLAEVQLIVDDPNQTAAKKLESYVVLLADSTHALASGDSQIVEVINVATKAYPELILDTNEQHCIFLKCIITEGVTNGEFKHGLSTSAIEAFQMSLTVFRYPFFVHLYTQKEFQQMARESAGLLISTLRTIA